jgi:hypothetical protein
MTRKLPLVRAAVTALWISFAPAPSYAATCNGGAGAGDSFFNAGLTCGESFTNGEPEPSHSGLSPVSSQPTFNTETPARMPASATQ